MVKLNKKFQVVGFVALLSTTFLNISCDDTSPTASSSNKFGVVASTWGSSGKVDVYFISNNIPEKIPAFTVNNQDVAPTFEDGFLYWEVENVNSGSTVNYTINYDGTALSGSFVIPGSVTLVTCNGAQCNNYYANSQTTDILKSNSYTFSWTASNASSYMISYDYTDGDEDVYKYDIFTNATDFTVTPSDSIRWGIDFYVAVYGSNQIKAGRTPDVSSSNAYVYHDIRGPRFNADIDVVSSLSKRMIQDSQLEKAEANFLKEMHEKLIKISE
jgi:hypothetical protein